MPTRGPTNLIAVCVALAALAVSIVVGLSVGNPTDEILSRGLTCMLIALPCGWCIGLAGELIVRQAIERAGVGPEPVALVANTESKSREGAAGRPEVALPTGNSQSPRRT